MLIADLVIGSVMVGLTVAIHVLGLVALIKILKARAPSLMARHPHVGLTRVLTGATVGIFLLHTFEIWVWAVFYILLGEFDSLGRALYFSTSTYTTLGYGDIILSEPWQLVSAFEAANGMILLGVSTAFAIGPGGATR